MDKLTINCATGEATREPLTAQEQADLEARQAAALAEEEAERQAETDWRAALQQDINWLQQEIAGAPNPGTTTSGNAVARLDALIQHVTKLDRGLLRLVRNIRDGVLDSEA